MATLTRKKAPSIPAKLYNAEKAIREATEAERRVARGSTRQGKVLRQVTYAGQHGATPGNVGGDATLVTVKFFRGFESNYAWPSVSGPTYVSDSSLRGEQVAINNEAVVLHSSLANITITGDAYVSGLRWDPSYGPAYLDEGAFVRSRDDLMVMAPIGTYGRVITLYRSTGGKYCRVVAGCYRGTIDQLATRVRKGPPDWRSYHKETVARQRDAYEHVIAVGTALQNRWRDEART